MGAGYKIFKHPKCHLNDYFLFYFHFLKSKLFRFYSPTSPPSCPLLLLRPPSLRGAHLWPRAVIFWEQRSVKRAGSQYWASRGLQLQPGCSTLAALALLPFKTGFEIDDSHVAISLCQRQHHSMIHIGLSWNWPNEVGTTHRDDAEPRTFSLLMALVRTPWPTSCANLPLSLNTC